MGKPEEIIVDQDIQWKELIEDLFDDWLEFFMPDVYKDVELPVKPEFLDKEFPKLLPEYFKGGKIINDRLAKIRLKNGEYRILIIHIEVQSEYEKEFSKRMFKYFYRIYDKYGENVESIAIFTDDNKTYRPQTYTYKKYQTSLEFTYRINKISDYKEEELSGMTNPFSLAALASQYLNKTKKRKDYDQRLQFKQKIARLMFERNYSREKVEKLLLFIANLLALPQELEYKFRTELSRKYLKYKTMPLTFENSVFPDTYRYEGVLIGREEGMEKGQFYKSLLVALNCIKENLNNEMIHKITSLSYETIDKVSELYKHHGENAETKIKEEFNI